MIADWAGTSGMRWIFFSAPADAPATFRLLSDGVQQDLLIDLRTGASVIDTIAPMLYDRDSFEVWFSSDQTIDDRNIDVVQTNVAGLPLARSHAGGLPRGAVFPQPWLPRGAAVAADLDSPVAPEGWAFCVLNVSVRWEWGITVVCDFTLLLDDGTEVDPDHDGCLRDESSGGDVRFLAPATARPTALRVNTLTTSTCPLCDTLDFTGSLLIPVAEPRR